MDEKETQNEQEAQDVEETQNEQEAQEESKEESKEDFGKVIIDLKQEYDAKIETLENNYKKQLNERDKVIKQLISDNKPQQKQTFIDKINAKIMAQNKKW